MPGYMPAAKRDDWETPQWLFDYYNDIYQFTLDGAANKKNAKVAQWCGPGGIFESGIGANWTGHRVWLNPPYGRGLYAWLRQVVTSNPVVVVALLPVRTDTKWFHHWCLSRRANIHFLQGRLRFKGANNAAPFASMVVTFWGAR